MSKPFKVLYTSYGSNVAWASFVEGYIKGNTRPGATDPEMGCRDKSEPTGRIIMASRSHQIYFSRNSSRWGSAPYSTNPEAMGGLGLVGIRHDRDPGLVREIDPSQTTLAELIVNDECILVGWEITDEQFDDVMAQENKGFDIGDFHLPQEVYELLTPENPVIDLRGRVGDNAIILPDGSAFDISMKGAYSAIMLVDEHVIEGETVKSVAFTSQAVTFTSPFEYRRVAAQTYVNLVAGNVPHHKTRWNDTVLDMATSRVSQLLGDYNFDHLARLNPPAIGYIEMIADGIVEIGEGNIGWDRNSAIEYVLQQPPFHEHQIPGLADQVRDYFAHQNVDIPAPGPGTVR